MGRELSYFYYDVHQFMKVRSKFRFFFNELFQLPQLKRVLKLWRFLNIKAITPNVHNLTFSLLHRFQENDVTESMWDKLKCYWELLEEQIWETIKNFMITHWELGGNTNENNKSPKNPTLLHLPLQKNLGPLGACCKFSLTKYNFFFLISFINYFGLGQW